MSSFCTGSRWLTTYSLLRNLNVRLDFIYTRERPIPKTIYTQQKCRRWAFISVTEDLMMMMTSFEDWDVYMTHIWNKWNKYKVIRLITYELLRVIFVSFHSFISIPSDFTGRKYKNHEGIGSWCKQCYLLKHSAGRLTSVWWDIITHSCSVHEVSAVWS